MKPIPCLIAASLTAATTLHSRETPPADSRNSEPAPTPARILGPVSDGTPPPPASPSLQFHQRLAAYQAAHPRTETITLGATIYHSKSSPPRPEDITLDYWRTNPPRKEVPDEPPS